MDRMEGVNYTLNKSKFVEHLRSNPFVAEKRGINMTE